MGFLFPKMPKFDNSALEEQLAREKQAEIDAEQTRQDNIKRRTRGFAGMIATSAQGVDEDAPTVKPMLGSGTRY
jgi:hypothetical protein|tara:strand:- start:155 stop:376 length:222 start_codon:yes stop_codon:yes gene_type:complete